MQLLVWRNEIKITGKIDKIVVAKTKQFQIKLIFFYFYTFDFRNKFCNNFLSSDLRSGCEHFLRKKKKTNERK